MEFPVLWSLISALVCQVNLLQDVPWKLISALVCQVNLLQDDTMEVHCSSYCKKCKKMQ